LCSSFSRTTGVGSCTSTAPRGRHRRGRAQQLVEAFPDDTAPRWLLRDRDNIYDDQVRRRIATLGITEVVSSPRSPWQNPYVERLIGSLRRECLNHVIVFNETHLRRIIRAYLAYYHRSRTHLSLAKDAPDGRACSSDGRIVVTPEVGGLHPATIVKSRKGSTATQMRRGCLA
jgi:transposase InsO family protein